MMMDWATIFSLASLFAMLAWVALIFGLRREIMFTGLREGAIGPLCLLYASVLILLMFFIPSPDGEGPDFSTIEGVRTIFATDGGVTLG